MDGSIERKKRPKSSYSSVTSLHSKKIVEVGVDFGKHTDLFAGIYKGNDINPTVLIPSFKKGLTERERGEKIEGLLKMKTKNLVKGSKSIEQVQEENNHLKTQNNKLKHEITMLKAKLKKKQQNLLPEADINVQNDLLWENSKNSHRIVRMRQQYEKLKKQYEEQKNELVDTKRKLVASGLPEVQTYIKELEGENKRLKKCIMNNGLISERKEEETSRPLSRNTINTRVSKELPKNDLKKEVRSLQEKLKQAQAKLKEKNQKIIYLQNSLIRKDNMEHSAKKKALRAERQNQQIASQYNSLRQQALQLIKKSNIDQIRQKAKHQQAIEGLNKKWEETIMQRDRRIQELTEMNRIILNEQTNKSRANTSQAHYKTQLGLESHKRKISVDFRNMNLQSARRLTYDQMKIQTEKNYQFEFGYTEVKSIPESRQPRRASINHFTNSKRLRKVQFEDVKQIGQLLLYRMKAHRIKPTDVKEYFLFNSSKSEHNKILSERYQSQHYEDFSSQRNNRNILFSMEYITMKETQEILQAHPFNLNQEQSFSLARYLIEDSDEKYVYCHQLNENKRQVAKSILKTVIGEWSLEDEEQVGKWGTIFSQMAENINKTLQAKYPSGFISNIQLINILKDSECGSNKQFLQILIGRMSIYSDFLDKLNYKQFFQQLII